MSRKTRRNRPAPPLPAAKYLEAAARLAAAADLAPGTVQVINVHHAAACDLLAGRGPCSCTPSVKLGNTN